MVIFIGQGKWTCLVSFSLVLDFCITLGGHCEHLIYDWYAFGVCKINKVPQYVLLAVLEEKISLYPI